MTAPRNSGAWFDQDLFSRKRQERGVTWGRPVRVLDETASTNDLALTAVDSDAKTGIVWLARQQTSGRGRRGNAWVSRAGESLLMSTLLRWPQGAPAAGVTLAVGLGLCTACEALAPELEFQVKWPNDLLTRDRKLGGILVESRTNSSYGRGVVLGVGLNLLTLDFPPGSGRPTSLLEQGVPADQLSIESVLVEVLLGVETAVRTLMRRDLAAVAHALAPRDALVGRRLRVSAEPSGDSDVPEGSAPLGEGNGRAVEGIGAGISTDGALLVETEHGLIRVHAGHVELLDSGLGQAPRA